MTVSGVVAAMNPGWDEDLDAGARRTRASRTPSRSRRGILERELAGAAAFARARQLVRDAIGRARRSRASSSSIAACRGSEAVVTRRAGGAVRHLPEGRRLGHAGGAARARRRSPTAATCRPRGPGCPGDELAAVTGVADAMFCHRRGSTSPPAPAKASASWHEEPCPRSAFRAGVPPGDASAVPELHPGAVHAGTGVMKLVITGATGNVGTSLLAALRDDTSVEEIVAIARRPADLRDPRIRFVAADIARDDLVPIFRGADAVVHLAWLIQPSRDDATAARGQRRRQSPSLRRGRRGRRAGARLRVVGRRVLTGAEGPRRRRVVADRRHAERRSTRATRRKCERLLDAFEREHPAMRVVRLRPGSSSSARRPPSIRRLFAGPLLPHPLVRRALVPVVPDLRGCGSRPCTPSTSARRTGWRRATARRVQHRRGSRGRRRRAGASCSAGRRVPGSGGPARAGRPRRGGCVCSRPRPGWFDVVLGVPIMDTTRARTELGWSPRHSATEALERVAHRPARRRGLPHGRPCGHDPRLQGPPVPFPATGAASGVR